MRYQILLLLSLIFGLNTFGQKYCTVSIDSFLMHDRFATYEWKINNTTFNCQSTNIEFKTNSPLLDTLCFSHNRGNRNVNDTIITRFTEGMDYIITRGCCDGGFEIYEKEKHHKILKLCQDLRQEDEEPLLWEGGTVSFKLVNYSLKDTLIGSYGDFAAMPIGKILINSSRTKFIEPHKGYFGSNTDYIIIATVIENKNQKKWYIDENKTVDWNGIGFEGLIVHAKTKVRLFNHEKIIVTFDWSTKQLHIEFDE